MAKRYTMKDAAELFAEEMGIEINITDFKTYATIIDKGLNEIKSPKNPEVGEIIIRTKKAMQNAQKAIAPIVKKAKEDRPVLDVIMRIKEIVDGSPNIDLQKFAKVYGNQLNETRTKAKTKNPTIDADGVSFNQRNKLIKALNLYNKLKQTRNPYSALNKVANKYGWKISTCKKNLTKARKLQK